MTTGGLGVTVDGLDEFRRALRASGTGLTRELSKGIRAAGKPPLAKAKSYAGAINSPRSEGHLAKSYRVSARGTSGHLLSKVPYGAGADWGVYGKWSGFRRYPPGPESAGRGRFVWRAVMDTDREIEEVLTRAIEHLLTIQGWASE